MRGHLRRAGAAAALAVLLAGCATFPDAGPREWREKVEGAGELGAPPVVPESPVPAVPPEQAPQPGAPAPGGCEDPDPQVVETCLEPVGAIAVLPDGETALVGERTTGRVLRVRRGTDPDLVTTVGVDPSGGGGLTGLVLSPGYAEDGLVYAYATTPSDNRVLRLAPGEPPKPVFTGIPRGPVHNGGALAVDGTGALLVATGDAGGGGPLAGAVLRIDTLGAPAPDNPDPASPVYATGLVDPGGICVEQGGSAVWATDRPAGRDVLHRVVPGPLTAPAWTWPERPGVAGCVAAPGLVLVAETAGAALFVLRPDLDGAFSGAPETQLDGTYGRLAAAAPAPDGLLWLGTVNKAGGAPVPSDDRVLRIQPPAGGGASRA